MTNSVLSIRDKVKSMLDEVVADERLHYPPVDVLVNAPLALIQVSLESRRSALKDVLLVLNKEIENEPAS